MKSLIELRNELAMRLYISAVEKSALDSERMPGWAKHAIAKADIFIEALRDDPQMKKQAQGIEDERKEAIDAAIDLMRAVNTTCR